MAGRVVSEGRPGLSPSLELAQAGKLRQTHVNELVAWNDTGVCP
jgi:hypothetical protein